ncbi:hypothetical protein F5888DRAFT_277043 [Russula emetica]|nr:hypothetical protein F5888DRAFT_277043 [Russula emetica]
MLRYPTQSDHRYGDATNPPVPQGSNTYWAPGGLDTSQPAVTRDSEDRHGPSRLRANQLTSSAYASAAPPFSLRHRDSYPALGQTQMDCPEQFAYSPQQYIPSVNYAAPPYDLAEYPIIPGSAYHSGQYPTQPSAAVTHFEYPPSDPTPFHHMTTYDPTGYINADGQYGLPLGSQHQQNLVSDPSVYLRCDGSFDHYETVTQHPALPVPPSSGSSELGNALVEISTPEPQSTGRTSISLPSLSLPSQPTPKQEPSEVVIGLNPVKTDPSLTGDHAPYMKEEDQESLHVGTSMPRASTPLHGHSSLRHRTHTHDSFRVVQDPAAYPEFTTSTKVRSCLTIAYSVSSTYRGTRRHRPSLFLVRTPILLVRVSPRRARRRSRLPIRGRLHRV